MSPVKRRVNGRDVLDTGQVCIGLLAEKREPPQAFHKPPMWRRIYELAAVLRDRSTRGRSK